MVLRIPLIDVDFDCEEIEAIQAVIERHQRTTDKITELFEGAFADYFQSRYAISVTNSIDALHLSCLALGLGPGDEVIVPSFAFVATANAIQYTGATPVFAEIESYDNLTLSPKSIESRISSNTRAILVVHYAGFPCDLPAILSIAEAHGLQVIEDVSRAVGAELSGRKLGTWADIGCFGFGANKNMIRGEVGILTTNNEELAHKLRGLRSNRTTTLANDCHKSHAVGCDEIDFGFNCSLEELRAAIGFVQLSKLDRNNRRRRQLLRLYHEILIELVPQVHIPFKHHPGITAAQMMAVLLPEGYNRNQIIGIMKDYGIQTRVHYPPIHTFASYKDEVDWKLGLTEDVASRELTLPLIPTMKVRNVLDVVEALRLAIII